jgi:hypothetical protein
VRYQGSLTFGRCSEIGHHGTKVKIRERPNGPSGNQSIMRDNEFESAEDAMRTLHPSTNLGLVCRASNTRSKYAFRLVAAHHDTGDTPKSGA